MLWNAEKELGIRQVVEDLERTHEQEQVRRALAHNTAATMRDSISLNIDNTRTTMNELRKSYLSVALVNNADGAQLMHSRRGTRL